MTAIKASKGDLLSDEPLALILTSLAGSTELWIRPRP